MANPRVTLCFKLVGSFAGMLALMVALSLCALYGIRNLGNALDTTIHTTAGKMRMAAEMDSDTHAMRVHAAMAEISLLNTMIGTLPGKAGVPSSQDAGCSSCHTADRVTSHRDAFAAALDDLLQNKAKARLLGENGRRFVNARYDFPSYIAGLESMFERAIGEARRYAPHSPPLEGSYSHHQVVTVPA